MTLREQLEKALRAYYGIPGEGLLRPWMINQMDAEKRRELFLLVLSDPMPSESPDE